VRSRFVLASASPRRRQLLKEAGYEFEVVSPRVDELNHLWVTLLELTIWNASRKAEAVSELLPNAVVLAADTLVTIGGKVLGKPRDLEDAVRILRLLSGRAHEVWTGVRIVQATQRKTRSFAEMSRVHFRKLDEPAIRNYLAKIDPLDKAGAYAAQGHGAEIIRRVEGSFSNVVGLPIKKTATALRAFGIIPRQ